MRRVEPFGNGIADACFVWYHILVKCDGPLSALDDNYGDVFIRKCRSH